jgi:hypothetical protein
MNKTKTFILLLSSAALVGCAQSNVNKKAEAPTGTSVEQKVVDEKLAAAVTKMKETEALGITVSGFATFDYEAENSTTYEGSTESAKMSANAKVSNLSIKAAATDIGKDTMKASASLSTDYTVKSSTTGTYSGATQQIDASGKMSAKAYVADKTVYVDATGMKDAVQKFGNSMGGSSVSISIADADLKRKTTIANIADWNIASAWEEIDSEIGEIKNYASKTEFLQGKNGTYSYLYTASAEKLISEIPGLGNMTGADGTKPTFNGEVKAWFTFTEDKFTEIGITSNASMKMEVKTDTNKMSISGYSLPSMQSETKLNVSLDGSFKVSFAYGDDVKVDSVENPETYLDPSTSTNKVSA